MIYVIQSSKSAAHRFQKIQRITSVKKKTRPVF
jgi:hypothetical protein